MTSTYDAAFYSDRRRATRYAAEKVLSVAAQHISFRRVADVGCGTGTWLAAALKMGATEAVGYEGEWISGVQLDDERIDLHAVDLEGGLSGAPTDLAISLEVAEHLSSERAESFVSDLCAMAPVILFSAAIPGQGGINHVNERWQSYWARKFQARSYRAFDVIRAPLWSDAAIPAWYRQNTVLYASESVTLNSTVEATNDLGMLDLVHPTLWNRANRELEYANAKPESEYLRAAASH